MRINNLDYLRGLAALGIMIYHYLSWAYGTFESQDLIGRLGVYGVSIFYILSGITLYHVYHDSFSLKSFFLKRFLRIYPLLWVAMGLTILIHGYEPTYETIFKSFTGLFGLIDWASSIGTGTWSIGNELTFYLLFPLLIYLAANKKTLFTIACLILLAVHLVFTFVILTPEKTLADQWVDYVNPLNQVFFFLGGFLIGKMEPARYSRILLIAGAALFIFYPAYGNTAHIVSGINRIIFTFICLLICYSIAKTEFNLPNAIHKPLATLGEISYSLYLLHPIVYDLTVIISERTQLEKNVRLSLSFGISLLVSYLSYRYFEKRFIRLGKTKPIASPSQ
jgi:exopolysaccharide production protein ExoZ